ncbi:hypothetical protein ACFP7A_05465 [Sporolactobacillus kofuensis]|uniref:Uncharacterized protein n=1 Tax=Sporolactobacillus kofuensis TaxID=269672 RepID=A0ABW1WEQ2_9BACL|nr:hypothetical protein [Sporolactobacillus kofuensis]MCO7175203.1 hypothetical protein [Sporolactobacillus kofuensis]
MKAHEDQMRKKSHCNACTCDETPDHQLCLGSPDHACPENIPTPRYRSPNSPLSHSKLDKLQKCIEIGNDLLRSLGNRRDPNHQRQLQIHLLDMRTTCIRVKIHCREKQIKEKGVLVAVGKNFITLHTKRKKTVIPFSKIDSLQHEKCAKACANHQELMRSSRPFKRDLVLHFGEIVSNTSELGNLFFGIPLHVMLVSLFGNKVSMRVENRYDVVSGYICGADEQCLQIRVGKEIEQIPLSKICCMTMKRD